MLRKLRRNLIENRHYLVGNLTSVIEDVVTVDGQHIAFGGIYGIEIFRLNIFLDGLRHSSHYHIETKCIHCLTMESLSHWLLFCIHLTYQVHQHIITSGPKKLFKVHWVHLYRAFFRWQYNALCIFLNAYQWTCLYVIVSTIFYQKLDGSSRPGTQLHLVKNDKRLAFV